jgi:hypothetical protein
MHVSSSSSYECCLALQLLRRGGNFVCKLFDVFTPFVSDLCYLMHQVFDKTWFRVQGLGFRVLQGAHAVSAYQVFDKTCLCVAGR